MTISTYIHFDLCLLHTQSPYTRSFIFKMAAMLQIPWVFPHVSCLGSATVVQCPCPGQTLATKVSKSHAIPLHVPGVNPPGWPLISALGSNGQAKCQFQLSIDQNTPNMLLSLVTDNHIKRHLGLKTFLFQIRSWCFQCWTLCFWHFMIIFAAPDGKLWHYCMV